MQPVTRDLPLEAELERAISEHQLRLVLLHGPRGVGRTTVLRSFAERMRSVVNVVSLVEAEALGSYPGACVDAWLRSRLGLSTGITGPAVEPVVDAAIGDRDPVAREFFCTLFGYIGPAFHTAALDARARWEGATAELERWLQTRKEPWLLLIDDAQAADAESLGVIEVLAASTFDEPALIVLAARDEVLPQLEPRLKPLRGGGRLTTLALDLPAPADLARDLPPEAIDAARGNPLLAKLLHASSPTLASAKVPALEALLADLARALPPVARQVLGLLAAAGGRLPQAVLTELSEPGVGDALETLCRLSLVSRAATPRFPTDQEVALRFERLRVDAEQLVEPERVKRWLGLLGAWAGQVVREGGHAWPSRLPLIAPLLATCADRCGDSPRASLAWELLGRAGGAEGLAGLRRAEATATGTRRAVLIRRIADEEVFRGDVQKGIATAAQAARVGTAAPTAVPEGWEGALFVPGGDPLERWDQLTSDEAQAAAELVRAEGLSHLAESLETSRAFEAVQARLRRLSGPATASLWMRWARTWSWFNAEILASGAAARRACELVRGQVSAEEIATSYYAPAFLRAEQIAHAHGGDAARARALADELIALAKARGDVRDECVAWNARALLHLRDGDLSKARAGFERSLDLSRTIGFRRREAIALHNLGLTLCQLGEFGASLACQERYLALSEQIGNFVARAYGPAAMAAVVAPTLDVPRAEALIARARKAAEENAWPALIAWTRLLSAELKLLRYLDHKDSLLLSLARNDLLACIDMLEETGATWAEELDPAQAYVLLALAWRLSANDANARAALERGAQCAAYSPVSENWFAAGRAVLSGARPDAQLAWLEEHGYRRTHTFWTSSVLPALGL